MRNIFVALLLVAALFNAQAQKLYRCGNNFSQMPCGTEAKPMYRCGGAPSETPCSENNGISAKVLAELNKNPTNADRVEAMKAACLVWLRTTPAWKDRDSLKFGSVTRGKFDVTTINGSPTTVVSYLTTFNAKNSYGGYTGEKLALCYANEQENQILHGITLD